MFIVSNLRNISSQAYEAIPKASMFLSNSLQISSELFSLLETYETSHSFSKINWLSKLTHTTGTIFKGSTAICLLLKYTFIAQIHLRQSAYQEASFYSLGVIYNLHSIHNLVTRFDLAKYVPYQFTSRPLQWITSSTCHLLASTTLGLWIIRKLFAKIQDWPATLKDIKTQKLNGVSCRDFVYALDIVSIVTLTAYKFFKLLGNNSRLHNWAKFSLITTSMGFGIAASLVKLPEIKTVEARRT